MDSCHGLWGGKADTHNHCFSHEYGIAASWQIPRTKQVLANQSGSTCTLPSLPPMRMENDSIVSLLPSLYQDVTAFADLNVNVKHDGARAGVCISQCNACNNNALNMGAEVRGCGYASMPCPVYGCLSTLCACTLVLK